MNEDLDGQDMDRNVLVTVKISQSDYNDMVQHFEKDRSGRPVVAVNCYFDVGESAPLTPRACPYCDDDTSQADCDRHPSNVSDPSCEAH